MTLEEFRGNDDWQTVFQEGYKESNMDGGVDEAGNPITREVKAFTMDDVVEVLVCYQRDGDYAETNLLGLFKTRDAYLFVSAWCDTTGWDCRADAHAEWHTDLKTLVACLSEEDRKNLGL